MKYVVCVVLDQTWGYLKPDGGYTTKHPEARLFDTRPEAEQASDEHDARLPTHTPEGDEIPYSVRAVWTAWIENVEDEAEFRAREDTW